MGNNQTDDTPVRTYCRGPGSGTRFAWERGGLPHHCDRVVATSDDMVRQVLATPGSIGYHVDTGGLPTPVVAGAPPLTGTLRLYLPSNTSRACDAVHGLVTALLDDPDTLRLLYYHHAPVLARRLQTAAADRFRRWCRLDPPPTLVTVHSDWTTVATECLLQPVRDALLYHGFAHQLAGRPDVQLRLASHQTGRSLAVAPEYTRRCLGATTSFVEVLSPPKDWFVRQSGACKRHSAYLRAIRVSVGQIAAGDPLPWDCHRITESTVLHFHGGTTAARVVYTAAGLLLVALVGYYHCRTTRFVAYYAAHETQSACVHPVDHHLRRDCEGEDTAQHLSRLREINGSNHMMLYAAYTALLAMKVSQTPFHTEFIDGPYVYASNHVLSCVLLLVVARVAWSPARAGPWAVHAVVLAVVLGDRVLRLVYLAHLDTTDPDWAWVMLYEGPMANAVLIHLPCIRLHGLLPVALSTAALALQLACQPVTSHYTALHPTRGEWCCGCRTTCMSPTPGSCTGPQRGRRGWRVCARLSSTT